MSFIVENDTSVNPPQVCRWSTHVFLTRINDCHPSTSIYPCRIKPTHTLLFIWCKVSVGPILDQLSPGLRILTVPLKQATSILTAKIFGNICLQYGIPEGDVRLPTRAEFSHNPTYGFIACNLYMCLVVLYHCLINSCL